MSLPMPPEETRLADLSLMCVRVCVCRRLSGRAREEVDCRFSHFSSMMLLVMSFMLNLFFLFVSLDCLSLTLSLSRARAFSESTAIIQRLCMCCEVSRAAVLVVCVVLCCVALVFFFFAIKCKRNGQQKKKVRRECK